MVFLGYLLFWQLRKMKAIACKNDYLASRILTSQKVVNFTGGKIGVSYDIINVMEDIHILTSFFQDIKIEYCNRLINI